MNRSKLFAALVALLVPAAAASAAVSYTYISDSPTYTATAAGQTITVNVDFNETLTSGSTSNLTVGNSSTGVGFSGAGYYVLQTGGTTGAKITAVTANSNAATATVPGFDSSVTLSQTVAANSLSARFLESENNVVGPQGASTAFGRQQLLGTISITAGAAGTSTTYTIEPYKNAPVALGGSGQNGNTVVYAGGNFFDLDVTSSSPAYTGANSNPFNTFTVSTTPEPASLALCGLGIGGLLLRRRKTANA